MNYRLCGQRLSCGANADTHSAVADLIVQFILYNAARLDPGVPAHDALRLMVDTNGGRKPMASWRRPPGRRRNVWLYNVQEDFDAVPLSIRCGDLRSPGVTERRNGPLGLRDDDDDDCTMHTFSVM